MHEKPSFIDKFLTRLDRLDQQSVKNYLQSLSEEKRIYQKILDELSEGIILVDASGTVKFINRQASLWLAIEPDKLGRGLLRECINDKILLKFMSDNLSRVGARTVEELHILLPRELHLRVYGVPLESGQTSLVVFVLFDRTADKNREHERLMASRIEAMVRLTAGLAHEIGNPLNSLSIHLELLKKGIKALPAEKQDRFTDSLDVLTSETARLDKIVRNFLRATRRAPLRFRTEDINLLLEEAINVMRPEFERKKMTIQFRQDANLTPFLVDRERLYPAFINLIKNALEAMDSGGVLRILVSHKDKVAFVRVQDSGRGIAENDLPHIFEPYFTTKEEGSGLGLMVVYDAVADHGGRIEVSTKINKGSTFTLLLPIRHTELQLTHQIRASNDGMTS